ncbi:sugar ABC transporter ATP-binding protein [Pseudomonas sp. TKO26]|uniref:ABC transporter ATP-binding protein n=1 Tax=unclassified Pseudomonas TaxID=196821 RepID=UPI000D98DA4A|nr:MULTISPECIES: ABC transporter ATP-binding protein [unclassified Pseudomonas]PYY79156.1 sugar ABC transporter ATP-binding protein [Pseudomonas sp. TKO30]PYY80378.1 sugar ABC transporter ATP-binding protein [Pseudomonas sp. TKO29]PYY82062.1 sugar ABC transporter ATP-binding protein [Pseudomonas sp. TKO26]PYY96914.1 sugar ABC transporter ATP-binding protein [Pseudomonas sp. TKO14]
MAHIIAKDLVVEFPIYQGAQRSMRKTFLKAATGGKLAGDDSRVTVRAVDGATFSINDGERVGLLGHNGSGKTTLLRALSGVYEPASGTLDMVGSITSLLDISQGFDLDSSGLENITLRAITMGHSPKRIKPHIDEICDFSGLGDYLKLPVRTYSSGMMMRLAFAISTSVDSDILLMDEWLSVGDDDFKERATERLTHLFNRAAIVVIASHDTALLTRTCTRILHVGHGKILREQTAKEFTGSDNAEKVQ